MMRRGLAPSRERAQADIAAGRVLVAGAVADKASRQVSDAEPIVLSGPPPRFVGRGGEKLDAALERFGVDPAGRRVLDAGASTGGFTDCVLQRGASVVVAVDVGYGQLHEKLSADARVLIRDRTNVRNLNLDHVVEPVGLVVGDLSFISLRLVLEPVLAVCTDDAELVVLVKPQFEAGRQAVSRGRGIISDPDVWAEVLASVLHALEGHGAAIMGAMASPITGADGNVEFLVHARRGLPGTMAGSAGIDVFVSGAVAEATTARGL